MAAGELAIGLLSLESAFSFSVVFPGFVFLTRSGWIAVHIHSARVKVQLVIIFEVPRPVGFDVNLLSHLHLQQVMQM